MTEKNTDHDNDGSMHGDYGNFDDKEKLSLFFSKVDIITYEFENISTNRAARDFQSFGLIEGTAVLPSKQ